MELSLHRVVLRFAQPVQSAHGVLRERELIELTLTDEEGLIGRGEAAPLQSYDGVSIERTLATLVWTPRMAALTETTRFWSAWS